MERLKAKVIKLERRPAGRRLALESVPELSDEEWKEFAQQALRELEGVPDDEVLHYGGPYPMKAGDIRELGRLMLEDLAEREA